MGIKDLVFKITQLIKEWDEKNEHKKELETIKLINENKILKEQIKLQKINNELDKENKSNFGF